MAKSALFAAGQVIEARILDLPQGTMSGYFDDPAQLAAAVMPYSGKGSIYATLNPVNPALLARATNRLVTRPKNTTSDTDITCRRWLPLDFDPRRPSGISSTEDEHAAALERAQQCQAVLREMGWPDPIYADSGNGAHLLYRIDLPNDPQSLKTIEGIYKTLAVYFSDDVVDLDQTTKNAGRIWKVYGTMSIKGDDTPDRPHRKAAILFAPAEPEVVPAELLMDLADSAPVDERPVGAGPGNGRSDFDLDVWIETSGLSIAGGPLAWNGGGRKWILNPCPWNADHTNKAAFIVQFASGAIAAGCRHNGCSGNHWPELRKLVDPAWAPYVAVEPLRLVHGAQQPADYTAPSQQVVAPPQTASRITADLIYTPGELVSAYTRFIQALKESKISLGWPEVDACLRGIAPGEVLTIIAKSGVGKSAILQNILRYIGLARQSSSLWASMEQPAAQVFERYAQMAAEIAGAEIEAAWTQGTVDRDRVSQRVIEEMGPWALTCDVPGLKIEELEQAVELGAQKIGRPINLLAIDYLGLIDGSDLDRNLYAAVSRVVREIKNLAKRQQLAVILLCQVSRAGGEDGSSPLTINSARESGAIEEAADFLLGLYRPNLNTPEQDDIMAIQILKNRKGKSGNTFEYEFDRKSMVIRSAVLNGGATLGGNHPQPGKSTKSTWQV